MKSGSKLYKFLTSVMTLTLIIIVTLIVFKANPTLKSTINQKVFNNHFDFVKVNELYEKFFGSALPAKKEKTEEVFNEQLEYSSSKKYKDGVELKVIKDYPVAITDSGIVTFVGEKEGYGNTVIIEQVDGVDVWYSNISTSNIKMYDYIEKGKLLGEVNGEKLYMVFQKEGKYLSYKEYI